jgi:hypothetical protein
MNPPIGVAAALMTTGLVLGSPESANAVVYCQYVVYPAHWVVRPGVVLGVRPVACAAAREAVRPGTPTNRGVQSIAPADADWLAR